MKFTRWETFTIRLPREAIDAIDTRAKRNKWTRENTICEIVYDWIERRKRYVVDMNAPYRAEIEG